MIDGGSTPELAEFDRPPVIEIVGASQFLALPRLALRDIVRVGQVLEGFDLEDLQPQLPPMTEAPPGVPEPPQMTFGFGQQPHRAMFLRDDGRLVAQLQRDRLAINERRQHEGDDPPSSSNVGPELVRFAELVNSTLVEGDEYGPGRSTVVELTYVNLVRPEPGVWEHHGHLDKVLRIVAGSSGDGAFSSPERVGIRFSFPLSDPDMNFGGRLHVVAEPGYSPQGDPLLHLNLFSRRLVRSGADLADVFETCHRDVVTAFTAITTSEIQEAWGRTK